MKNFIIKKEYIYTFLAFLLFWVGLFLFTKAIFSGFHLTDDYLIPQIKNEIEKNGLINTFIQYMTPDLAQRLKPLCFPFRFVRIIIFGNNYYLWSLHLLISATISSFLFYLFARILKFSIIESILFSIYSILGYQAIIWFHLCYDETLGIIFLSFALLFLALEVYSEKHNQIYNHFFSIFTLLMALCKEPFIMLIPAMIYLKHQVKSQKLNIPILKSIKKDYDSLFLLLIFVLSIIYLKFGIKTLDFGYCGISGFDFKNYIRSFSDLFVLSNGMNYIILGALLSCLIDKERIALIKKFAKENKHVFVVFGLIVVPQCILYTKSGFFARYLTPALIGYAYLTINSLRFFRLNIKSRISQLIIYALVIISIVTVMKTTLKVTQKYANEGITTQEVLNLINDKIQPDKKIVIVGDTTVNFEQTQAFKKYLEQQKNAKTNIKFYPVFTIDPSMLSPFDLHLIEKFQKDFKGEIQNTIDKDTYAIIVFKSIYSDFLRKNKNNLNNFVLYDYNNFKVYIKVKN